MVVLERGEYLTFQEIERETGYKANTVYKWLRRHNIPVKRTNWLILVKREDVEKYVQQRKGL